MTLRTPTRLAMRPFAPADGPLLAEIFRASIAELSGDDYSEAQQQAWASLADDEAGFASRLAGRLTVLGTIDGEPAGFASLADGGRLDMLYVHPAAARRGVGSMLVDALEKLAAARGAPRLTADVSDNAQEFFRGRGFVPRQRNSVPMGQEWLASTTMDKPLASRERNR